MTGMHLTKEQEQAVEHVGGPLIVLAGPGTGKTRVIVERVAHMIERRGIAPERIAALTFTNKAAGELRDRLATIVGGSNADAVFAGTFHSFGFMLLRRFADLAGLAHEPKLLDSSQQRRMLRALITDHHLFRRALVSGMNAVLEESMGIISAFRNAGLQPQLAQDRLNAALGDASLEDGPRAELERMRDHVTLFGAFDRTCEQQGVLTVDDLITRPVQLLRNFESVRAICRHDYAHLVIDEFQDLNRSQIELLSALCGEGEPDLCVVGDDDQAIYGFRGADQFAFKHFAALWPSAEQIVLSENWRSGSAVVEVANAVIGESESRFAPDKIVDVAAGSQAEAGAVESVALDRVEDDGDVIAAMILLDRQTNPERAWSDYAVIARTHGDLDRVAGAFELEGVPTIVTRASPVVDNPGVQDLLAWINIIIEPGQSWGVRRILTRPPFGIDALTVGRCERSYRAATSRLVGDDTLAPLVDWLHEHYTDDETLGPHVSRLAAWTAQFRESANTEAADATVQRIIIEAGLTNADLPDAKLRTERIESLVTVLRFVRERLDRLEQPRDLAAFMRYYNDLDRKEQGFSARIEDIVDGPDGEATGEGDAVRLMTAHGAKGLEFDTVFLPRVGQHGYPKTGGSKPFNLPTVLTEAEEVPPAIEEERRIFYVACTRAQRRLVLLAKRVKKPGHSNFLGFLDSHGLTLPTDATEQLERAAEAGLGRYDKDTTAARLTALRSPTRRDILAHARQRLRSEAALSLDIADRTPFDPDLLTTVDHRLRQAALRMAIVATLDAGASIPKGLDTDTDAFARSLHAELASTEPRSGALSLRPPSPPLHLSYTSLSAYIGCPRCYYVKHVMNLPDAVGSSLRVGSAAHRALEIYCKAWREAETVGHRVPDIASLENIGRDALFAQVEPDEPVDPGELAQLLAQLRVYAEHLHDETDEPVEIERKAIINYPHAGHTHRLTAKIDRIDRTPTGIRIIDYKTGLASKRLLEPKADDLQLGLYAMAARQLYDDPDLTGSAEYWLLSTGQRGIINFAEIDDTAICEQINTVIEGILAGQFECGKTCYGSCAILDGATAFD